MELNTQIYGKMNNKNKISQGLYDHFSFIQEPFTGIIEGKGVTCSEIDFVPKVLNDSCTEFIFETSHTGFYIELNKDSSLFTNDNSSDTPPKDESSFLDIVKEGIDKSKKKIGEAYDNYSKWYFENVTCKNESDLWSFPYDARGEEILDYWLLGYGKDRNIVGGLWQDYMSDNGYIREHLEEVAQSCMYEMQAQDMNYKVFEATGYYHMEIQNGYLTGYEMLHGTQFFNIEKIAGTFDPNTNTYTFDFSLEWKDRIDPNISQGDGPISTFAKKLNPNAKDYNISIRWNQQIKLKVKSKKSSSIKKIKHSGSRRINRRILE